MILNIYQDNFILKKKAEIFLSNLTILTGENGSGKTQLLYYIGDNTNGFVDSVFEDGQAVPTIFPLVTDVGIPLTEIVYAQPGIRDDVPPDYNDNGGIIKSLETAWLHLEPLRTIYCTVDETTMPNEHLQLLEINNKLSSIINVSLRSDKVLPFQPIQEFQLQMVKKLAKICKKNVSELTFVDFISFHEVPTNLFSSSVNFLFHQFALKQKYHPELIEGITPPWIVFNDILDSFKFNYSVKYVQSDDPKILLPVLLMDGEGNEIDFNRLSTGETTILKLVFVLYHSSEGGHFPEVILFDEPDAHLHPSLTQNFLDVIQNILVKKNGLKVILTTHSPSTVALAPEESIFVMKREFGHPIKGTKKEAIDMLTSGLTALTIEESNLGITYIIESTQKDILFTEGITDKIILTAAWSKLYPNVTMPFYIQDCFDAGFLSNFFVRGLQGSKGVFHQQPSRKMIALFDFDHKGYSMWEKEAFSEKLELDPAKCLLRKAPNLNAFLMLLPVPSLKKISELVIDPSNNSIIEFPALTIELLFFGVEELKDFFHANSTKLKSRSKVEFAKAVKNLSKESFNSFVPLFTMIKHIVSI